VQRQCPNCEGTGASTDTSSSNGSESTITGGRDGPAPEGAGRFFPFESTRPGQAGFIKDVRSTLKNGDVLLAQVPTGVGKTAGVLSPALEVASRSRSTIFFLTSKQSQHKVAIETLKLTEQVSGTDLVASDVISKKEMCPQPESEQLGARAFGEFCSKAMASGDCSYYMEGGGPSTGLDEEQTFRKLGNEIHHVEEAVDLCEDNHHCPFKLLNEVARVANVVVLDYNHFFSDLINITLDRFDVDLEDAILVIDEAHNLPDRIRSHLTWRLTPAMLHEAADEAGQRGAHPVSRFLDRLAELVENYQGREAEQLEVDDLMDPIHEILETAFRLARPDYHDFIDELGDVADAVEQDEAVSACGEVLEFLDHWPGSRRVDEESVLRMWDPEAAREGAMVFRILDAGHLAGPIFSQVKGAVLMSGTLYPTKMYSGILGVPRHRAVHEEYPNPFPEENRKVAIDPGVTSKASERGPDMYRRIAKTVGEACQATPGNVACFFPSYAMMDDVQRHLPRMGRRVLVEEREFDKAERETMVNELETADGNALMFGVQGGSLSEGYDFEKDSDNLLKTVFVVGVPYAAPTLEVQHLREFYDEKFGDGAGWRYGYLAPALQRVLQAAGRAIRASHHEAFIGLLDRRFSQRQIQSFLPPDMNPTVEQDIGDAVDRFFGRR